MCIIAVKPRNIKNPSEETLRNMFYANPDGAGVAFNLNGKLYIIKGLMTFEAFWEVCKIIPQESAAIYHTRIETSGGVCKELTHPFLLDKDVDKQRQIRIEIDKGEAVAHNGVFNEFRWKEKNNDTTQFISTYLAPLKRLKDKANERILDYDIKEIINKLCDYSNKLAIIDERGETMCFGDNWIYENGIYYSNYTFRHRHCIFKWQERPTNKSTSNKIEILRKTDPDFDMVYRKWHSHMIDDDIIEYYEQGWIF